MTNTFKERNELIMKKLNELNIATRKAVDTITEEFLKTTDIDEDQILCSLDKSVNERRYTEKYIASTPEFKKKLLKEYRDLEKSIEILSHRKYKIVEELERQTRDKIVEFAILGTVKWELDKGYSKDGVIYLKASLHENDAIYSFLKDPFGYDYHWSYIIFTFEDGRNINMRCDDGELTIDLSDNHITPEEYKEALDVLGIKISFDSMNRTIEDKQSSVDRLRQMVKLFGGDTS